MMEDRILAHLEIIESVYGVEILNKSRVVQWIGEITDDDKQALTIATALNTWIMMNSTGSGLEIPITVLEQIQANLISKSR
ncbi:MAG: hypothetical protein C5S33_03495 [ANME-2 cluster archaeon]|jgi:hypothetical protein|nr:MAG: hypothetical protein C5S45_02730 [ANME-2 cluster archaeon]MRG76813.1 hypothetical protein [ANME-2 cluster archaeon]